MNILEARRRVLGGEVYKKTAEGNPVSVRSLARMRPGLSIMGKSTQQTTTGAQFLDVDNLSPDPSANDITSLIISDGGYEWEEMSAFTTNRYLIAVKPNTNYTLSVGSITRGANLQISDYLQETKTGLDHTISIDTTAFSFNTGELSEVTMSLFSGLTGIQKITDIMLCEGANVKPWEPYTGGQPSPSPDYPQEITSAGDDGSIEVDITGANICPENQKVNVNINETGNMIHYGYSGLIPVVPGEKYYPNASMIVRYFDESKELVRSKQESIITPNENEKYIKLRTVSEIVSLGDDFKIMINAGSTALPWEPYKQPQSLTVQTPNGLPGIPVSSGGNYTDSTGQQWICDEIDFKRGKYVKRVEIVKGEDFPYISKGINSQKDTEFHTKIDSASFILDIGMSNKFINYNVRKPFTFTANRSGYIYFRLPPNATKEDAIECLKHSVFYVGITTPIETDLPEEQLSTYSNLHTNRPTTVVSATDGAGLGITYKTKKSLEVT